MNLRISKNLSEVLKNVEVIILAIHHKQYLNLNPIEIVTLAGNPIAVINCFGILSDDAINNILN